MEQKHYAAGVALFRRAYRVASNPEILYPLGDALAKAGLRAEAKSVLAKFEKAALTELEGDDNANRELVLYYLDHANRPKEALRIAKLEAARRRDLHTLEVYAAALRRNGNRSEAERVLAESRERLSATSQKSAASQNFAHKPAM